MKGEKGMVKICEALPVKPLPSEDRREAWKNEIRVNVKRGGEREIRYPQSLAEPVGVFSSLNVESHFV